MNSSPKHIKTIDEYIERFPPDVQDLLQQIRKTIRKAAPQAEEAICYMIPTFKYRGNLVHFAAYKQHIGFYPTSSGVKAFAKDITSYKSSRGTIQFPLDQPIPLALVRKIVKFRLKEVTEKSNKKKK